MRFIFGLFAVAVFGFTTPSVADTPLHEGEDVSESSEWAPQQQWNRWICHARSLRSRQTFYGMSWFFRAGSGEGQQARQMAARRAERKCQFYTRSRCFVRQNTCRVQRFNS